MCEHCGCEPFGPAQDLHADHERILQVIDRIDDLLTPRLLLQLGVGGSFIFKEEQDTDPYAFQTLSTAQWHFVDDAQVGVSGP